MFGVVELLEQRKKQMESDFKILEIVENHKFGSCHFVHVNT